MVKKLMNEYVELLPVFCVEHGAAYYSTQYIGVKALKFRSLYVSRICLSTAFSVA